jgi:hypothetical protein
MIRTENASVKSAYELVVGEAKVDIHAIQQL